MSRAVLRGMFRRKTGVILNLGSLAGVRMIEAPVHYYTSKAAIKGFTEALAKEVARHNVRVLCLAPGLLEDGVGRNLPDHKRDDYLHHCALGRVGTFAEVAEFAAFLVSDTNSYQSGATVVMDGCV
jgi:NAD(P)-dependent dehydrogenase (short-subunit alcohol dehydrogenase family)